MTSGLLSDTRQRGLHKEIWRWQARWHVSNLKLSPPHLILPASRKCNSTGTADLNKDKQLRTFFVGCKSCYMLSDPRHWLISWEEISIYHKRSCCLINSVQPVKLQSDFNQGPTEMHHSCSVASAAQQLRRHWHSGDCADTCKLVQTTTACSQHARFREAVARWTRYWLLSSAFITHNLSESTLSTCSKLDK